MTKEQSSTGSVSCWIGLLKQGNHEAAQRLWECYYQKLIQFAAASLQGVSRRVADEEDVALSAFDSFCRAAARQRFPQLVDRDDLWKLLLVITSRKALDLVTYQRRDKRGGGAVRGDSAFLAGSDRSEGSGMDGIAGKEPTPAFAAQVAEECHRLLDSLGDDILRRIAVWKMDGFTNEEISLKLDCSLTTVERKLRLIRRAWSAGQEGGVGDI
jgi:DNA-directed RNA polymerase specialized sigma24 family protein